MWDQKGTNKTLALMGLGFFCQLLKSPKLPLIIFIFSHLVGYVWIYVFELDLDLATVIGFKSNHLSNVSERECKWYFVVTFVRTYVI